MVPGQGGEGGAKYRHVTYHCREKWVNGRQGGCGTQLQNKTNGVTGCARRTVGGQGRRTARHQQAGGCAWEARTARPAGGAARAQAAGDAALHPGYAQMASTLMRQKPTSSAASFSGTCAGSRSSLGITSMNAT